MIHRRAIGRLLASAIRNASAALPNVQGSHDLVVGCREQCEDNSSLPTYN